LEGQLSKTIPTYDKKNHGRDIIAYPDGSLTTIQDTTTKYPYLFWEGIFDINTPQS
jgi:hypothetical protein